LLSQNTGQRALLAKVKYRAAGGLAKMEYWAEGGTQLRDIHWTISAQAKYLAEGGIC
jgi:hypothetical protein